MCAAALAVKCSGPVITLVQGCLQQLTEMAINKDIRKRYHGEIKLLNAQLSEVSSLLLQYPEIQKRSKLIMELHNVDEILKQGLSTCKKLHDTTSRRRVINVVQAESQAKTLENLKHDLDSAQKTVQAACTLIGSYITKIQSQARSKENERTIGLLNPQRDVFEYCDGELHVPLVVTGVAAEVPEADNVYLMISWNDCEENARRNANKYEIMLESATDPDWNTTFHCPTCSIKITEKVTPWEKYNIKVRAVNDVGFGPWSELLSNVLIDKCPPKQPQLKDVSYNAINRNSLYIVVQRTQEHNEQQVRECILKQTHPDATVIVTRYPFLDHKSELTMLIGIPHGCQQCKYQIKFENKTGTSSPMQEQNTPLISSLIPGKPRKLRFIEVALTHTEVWITWEQPKKNAGALHSYKVEKRQLHSPWEELPLPPETNNDPLENVLKNLKIDPALPQVASQLHLQSATQNEDQIAVQVVKDLKQDTLYEFRILAANEEGQTGPPSRILKVKTKLHEARERAAKMVNTAIQLFSLFVSNYPNNSSRIVHFAQSFLLKYDTQPCLPAPTVQTSSDEPDSDSDSDIETEM